MGDTNDLLQKRFNEIQLLIQERDKAVQNLPRNMAAWGVGGGAAVAAAVVLTGGLAAVTAPFIAGSVVGRAMWKGGAGSVLRSRDNIQELNKKIDSLSKSLLADFKNQLSQGNIDYKESIKFYYQMNSLDVSLKEELEQMKKDLDI